MSLKDSLQKKLETQADYWSKQINSLQADAEERIAKAKDEQAQARIQKEFSERIQQLQGHVQEARDKITEIRNTGEGHLDRLKGRVDEWLSKRG